MKRLAISIATPDDDPGALRLSETFMVRGELDIASSSVLEHVLIDELTAIPDEIVLALSELDFIDIAGFRALWRVRRHLAAHGCRLTLRSVPPQATRLLELAVRMTASKPADAWSTPAPADQPMRHSPRHLVSLLLRARPCSSLPGRGLDPSRTLPRSASRNDEMVVSRETSSGKPPHRACSQ